MRPTSLLDALWASMLLVGSHAWASTSRVQDTPLQQALTKSDIQAPKRLGVPLLACNKTELGRLRDAWSRQAKPVRSLVAAARKRLKQALVFPPRGGQHNQWYQCESCQMGLETLSATKHRCPKCKKVYSGAPYDDVIFSRVHARNWRRARDGAWAYSITGDKDLFTDARRIVMGYAERYESYPYHTNSKGGLRKNSGGGHIKEQSLSEASLMIDSIVPACDLIWSQLSEADRKQVSQHLIRPMLENLERAPRGKSNWQSFHNAAMFAGGALIGEARWMRRSILHKTNGFLFQMRHCVSPEGMWFENSWGYHLYTLRALTAHAEFARRAGIDLWHHGPLQKMVVLPIAYTMPDGSLPRFGDDVSSRIHYRMAFIQAARPVFESPLLERMSQGPESWSAILYGNKVGPVLPMDQGKSQVFRGAGHAILRSPGNKRLCSAITFGRFGGFHGHFDKLSFVFFAYGQELGVDPGRARSQAYRLPIHKLWYRGTIAHNTVVVDGKAQRGTGGKLLLFKDNERCQVVIARVTSTYKKIRHTRCLIQTRDFLLVLDDLQSTGPERRFDWIYHNRGVSVACEQTTGEPRQQLGISGDAYVRLESTGVTDKTIQVRFHGPRQGLLLHMPAATPETRIFTGTGVGQSVLDRVPLVVLRRQGSHTSFACLLEPLPTGEPSRIRAFTAQKRQGVWHISVQVQDQRMNFRWDGGASLESSTAAKPHGSGKGR